MAKEGLKEINILDLLHQAVGDCVLLDIKIDEEEKQYGARLLSLSITPELAKKQAAEAILKQYSSRTQQGSGAQLGLDTDGDDARWMLITPLEPTDGNLRIRKSKQVSVGFYLGLEQFNFEVAFRKVQMVKQGQAIELSWPDTIKKLTIRQQLRVEVPSQMDLSIQVQKRGEKPFVAKIVDISAGGLSFASSEAAVGLQVGDKVGVAIKGAILMGTPISTYGSITFIIKARHRQNVQVTEQVYGLQFKLLAVADAMTVDRLVKALGSIAKSDNPAAAKKVSL